MCNIDKVYLILMIKQEFKDATVVWLFGSASQSSNLITFPLYMSEPRRLLSLLSDITCCTAGTMELKPGKIAP